MDANAIDVGNYVENNKYVVNIYVEHGADETSGLVDFPKCIDVSIEECVQEDNSEESDYEDNRGDEAKCIKFDDSEDERALGLDDGFDVDESPPPKVVTEQKCYRVKTTTKITHVKKVISWNK